MFRTAVALAVLLSLLLGCGRSEPVKPKLSQAAENRIRGQVFLAENAEKPGIAVLPSGLQYKVISEGTGPIPTASDKVRVHYRGMFIDRKEFESSRDRTPEPVEFPVRSVIRGWQDALQHMSVGSHWEIYVPSNLAYGLDNAPEKIGPNQTLIFEIELISIIGKPTAAAP
jgi:FKBP-type peptidyl-prolyl cis-trans isomerase FklB